FLWRHRTVSASWFSHFIHIPIRPVCGSVVPTNSSCATPPTAHFTMSGQGQTATDGNTLILTADQSGAAQVTLTSTTTPGTGTINSYVWKSNGIPVCTTTPCTVSFAPSTDTISLTVTDSNSLTSSANGTLVVNPQQSGTDFVWTNYGNAPDILCEGASS